jgi:hypothetical protein
VGSGWLREAPANVRAMMRRCLVAPYRVVPGAPLIPVSHRHRSYGSVPARHDLGPAAKPAPKAVRAAPAVEASRARPAVVREALGAVAHPWWDDPIALGALLVAAPPVGLAALWASRHYTREARWAITSMMGLMLVLATALAIVMRGR